MAHPDEYHALTPEQQQGWDMAIRHAMRLDDFVLDYIDQRQKEQADD